MRRCGADGAGELGGSGRPGASTPCPRRAGPASWLGRRAGPVPCWGRCCRRLGGGRPAPCRHRGPGPGPGSSSGAGGRPPPRAPLGAAPPAGVRGAPAMPSLLRGAETSRRRPGGSRARGALPRARGACAGRGGCPGGKLEQRRCRPRHHGPRHLGAAPIPAVSAGQWGRHLGGWADFYICLLMSLQG